MKQSLGVEELLDVLGDVGYLFGRLIALDDLPLLVDEELGEVPLDVGALLVVGVSLREHLVEDGVDRVGLIPTGEAFLLFKEFIERGSVIAIDFYLFELRKLSAVGELTEVMDTLVGAGSLLAKLVAWEVKDLEALSVVCLVEIFR